MKMKKVVIASLLLSITAGVSSHTKDHDRHALDKALQIESRPQADRERDAGRKPAEIIRFAGIKPGMRVLDLVASGGYYTEVLSHQVGKKGEVLAHNNNFMLTVMDGRFKKEMDSRLAQNRLSNVTQFHKEFGEFGLKSEVDAATMVLNYHDIYNQPKAKRMALLNEIKTALKPGGIFLVIDMEANAGEHNPKLHRVNSKVVEKEITSAGFKFAGETNILRNPKDDHSLVVFNPTIRGKADRFVYKFVK